MQALWRLATPTLLVHWRLFLLILVCFLNLWHLLYLLSPQAYYMVQYTSYREINGISHVLQAFKAQSVWSSLANTPPTRTRSFNKVCLSMTQGKAGRILPGTRPQSATAFV